MQLVGMMDSPYVRRVAISLRLMQIPFTHSQISVFRQVEQFAAINPVIKAPTLVTDDGVMLMDSSLILEYAEGLAPQGSLMPADSAGQARALHLIGLGLAACDKSVQILYERIHRPVEKQHQPWLDRLSAQARAAYDALENSVPESGWLGGGMAPLQPDVTVAVAWRFTQSVVPGIVAAASYPRLGAFSARAEALPEFIAAPFG